VNQTNDAHEDIRRPMGALACIVTGFEVVARHPTLIILPLALDLWLWLGPRLSIAPVLQASVDRAGTAGDEAIAASDNATGS